MAPKFKRKGVNSLTISNANLADILGSTVHKEASLKFTARGRSMFPYICNGDVITIHPVSKKQIRLGDVVAYVCKKNKKIIIHRIINKCKGKYRLKGDNLFRGDGLHDEKEILGYVEKIHRSDSKRSQSPLFQISLRLFKMKQGFIAFLNHIRLLTLYCRILYKLT